MTERLYIFGAISQTAVAVLCVVAALAPHTAGCHSLSGRITPSLLKDTLVIDYRLIVKDCHECTDCPQLTYAAFRTAYDFGTAGDSFLDRVVWLSLGQPSVITEGKSEEYEWRGQLRMPGYQSGIPHRYQILLSEVPPDSCSADTSRAHEVLGFVFYSAHTGGRRSVLGIASSTNSHFDDPIRSTDRSLVWRLEDRLGYYDRHFSVLAGYSFNYSKRFSLYDYCRLEIESIPWGRDRWLPIFHLAVSYSRVKGYSAPNKFVKKGWGVEIGGRIDGPFESLRYSYNTTAGGYHRVDLLLACLSSGDSKVGTTYSVYSGKYVRMIALSVYLEGWGFGDETLPHVNHRPWPHKALAWLALVPFLPLALASAG